MPSVRFIPEGEAYTPASGERLLQLQNSGDVPLYIGIRNGQYMIAQPAIEPQVTYVLTQEQWVRLQQQMQLQTAYKNWVANGLLTLVEVDEVTVPDPPAPPPPPTPSESPQ